MPKIRRFFKIKPGQRVKESGKVYSRKKLSQPGLTDTGHEPESRVIGLDVGKKRVGVAMSDPLRITAQPVDVVETEEAILKLKRLTENYDVELFVIGNPLTLDGHPEEQAQSVLRFAKKLRDATGLPFILEDERLSTKAAERTLRQMGRKPSREKEAVDQMAAIIILQSYLDRENSFKRGNHNEEA